MIFSIGGRLVKYAFIFSLAAFIAASRSASVIPDDETLRLLARLTGVVIRDTSLGRVALLPPVFAELNFIRHCDSPNMNIMQCESVCLVLE
jgi:hypothetical protein